MYLVIVVHQDEKSDSCLHKQIIVQIHKVSDQRRKAFKPRAEEMIWWLGALTILE